MNTYFDINELILNGKKTVKPYDIPNGRVYVRPLTDLELNECDALAFDAITDVTTRNYMMKMSNTTSTEEIPEGVKMGEILRASAEVNTRIAYLAMKDFTEGLTPELVVQLSGLSGLADFIREISGATPDTKEKVEEFRE